MLKDTIYERYGLQSQNSMAYRARTHAINARQWRIIRLLTSKQVIDPDISTCGASHC
jgi:hypothetical protein